MSRPGRLRAAATRAHANKRWYRIQNVAATGVVEVWVYDEIGLWGVTAAEFVRELQTVEAVGIDLHINSPGGDVFDGIAIYNALCTHPATVNAYIDGLAASAASFIAQAGAKVCIARNASMMIHDAEGVCIGNASDMTAMAELLERTSDNIADIYAQRSGTVKQWRKAMQAESWFTGKEAVDVGLADEVYESSAGDEGTPAPRRRRTTDRLPLATAVGPHSTAVAEGTWDAGTQEGRLPSPVPVGTARAMYCWYDGDRVADGAVPKDACKLPHHTVAEDGTPGAANLNGVRNALSRLPQTQGLSESERETARRHLQGHLDAAPDDDADPGPTASDTTAPTAVFGEADAQLFRAAVLRATMPVPDFDAESFRLSMRALADNAPAVPDPPPSPPTLPPLLPAPPPLCSCGRPLADATVGAGLTVAGLRQVLADAANDCPAVPDPPPSPGLPPGPPLFDRAEFRRALERGLQS